MELVNGSVSGDVVSALRARYDLQLSEVVVRQCPSTTSNDEGRCLVVDFVGDRAVEIAKLLEGLNPGSNKLATLYIASVLSGEDVSAASYASPSTAQQPLSPTAMWILVGFVSAVALLTPLSVGVYCLVCRRKTKNANCNQPCECEGEYMQRECDDQRADGPVISEQQQQAKPTGRRYTLVGDASSSPHFEMHDLNTGMLAND